MQEVVKAEARYTHSADEGRERETRQMTSDFVVVVGACVSALGVVRNWGVGTLLPALCTAVYRGPNDARSAIFALTFALVFLGQTCFVLGLDFRSGLCRSGLNHLDLRKFDYFSAARSARSSGPVASQLHLHACMQLTTSSRQTRRLNSLNSLNVTEGLEWRDLSREDHGFRRGKSSRAVSKFQLILFGTTETQPHNRA